MIGFFKEYFRKDTVIKKPFISKFLPQAPIIVEAGAHVGTDTLEMINLWPDAKIHCFEPVPDIFNKLKRNTKSLKNITCYPLALSDTTGETVLFVSNGDSDASSSLLKPKEHLNVHPNVKFDTKINVKTTTLDDWAKKYKIFKIDFLWLDLQGLELNVLKASTQILKSVEAIYSEVSLVEDYEGLGLYPDLREWLGARGFKVEKEILPWKNYGNVLFIRY